MVCIVITVGAGLLTRRIPVLAAFGKYPGDGLWALMMFFIVGLIRPRTSTWRAALIALAISYVVEVSQLYEPPWLVSIRSTTLGHLVLGSKFHVGDLVAYSVAIALGAALEIGWKAHRARRGRREAA